MRYLKAMALAMVLAVMCGCGRQGGNPAPSPGNDGRGTPAVEEKKEYTGTPVTTPAGVIYIPQEWETPVEYTEDRTDGIKFVFTTEGETLYEIVFSTSEKDALGICQTENGFMYVAVKMEEAENATDDFLSKQESVNVLLEQLELKPVSRAEGQTPDKGSFLLETACGEFEFSAQWQGIITAAENADGAVEFMAAVPGREKILLFTVSGKEAGSHFSVKKDRGETELFVTVAEIDFDSSWSEEDKNLVYAMQEEINRLNGEMQ